MVEIISELVSEFDTHAGRELGCLAALDPAVSEQDIDPAAVAGIGIALVGRGGAAVVAGHPVTAFGEISAQCRIHGIEHLGVVFELADPRGV